MSRREAGIMIIAIGGPPGGGKTTVAEKFAQAHAYALVSAGRKFREMAKARGLSLEAFGKAAESDLEIDRSLDHAVLKEILEQDAAGRDVIVDGRIQAQLLAARRVPCLKVFLTAPLHVRAQRIAGREKKPQKAAEQEILAREASEQTRYDSLYKIDLKDLTVYDVVIDSSDKAPDQIVELVWSQVEG